MQTRELKTQVFDNIGSTPDEVAATLRAYGIRGLRNSTRYFNPVVQYAYRQLGNHALHIDVKSGATLTVIDGNSRKELMLPQAVFGFLVGFNDGKYTDLESDESADVP